MPKCLIKREQGTRQAKTCIEKWTANKIKRPKKERGKFQSSRLDLCMLRTKRKKGDVIRALMESQETETNLSRACSIKKAVGQKEMSAKKR